MENPLKYSDLLQPDNSIQQAIDQLEKLNETYAQTLKQVNSEAIKLKASVEQVSGATEEHRTRIRNTAAEVDKLAKAQRDLEFAQSEAAKELARLKEEQREAQNIAKLTAKLNASEAGSYNALSAQYSLNKIQLNKLSQEYRENTAQGKKLVKETEEIYAKMKQLQEATGKYTLNVGNYKSAWDGLGVSATQLVRELPSLAVSANTFFLAISNNIPMLVDEINKLKAANAAAAAAGEATVPIWRSVARAFLSWNTVISLGITLLTVYGGDIIKWIQNLTKSKKEIDLNTKSLNAFNDAMLEGAKNAAASTTRLNILYRATQDQTRSIEERTKAVKALQTEYPSYFGNLTQEQILAGEAADAYNRLTQSITASARARATVDAIEEQQKTVLENERKITDAYTRLGEAEQKLQQIREFNQKEWENMNASQRLNAEVAETNADTNIKTIEKEIAGYRSAIREANKISSELERSINVDALLNNPEQDSTTTRTTGRTPRDRTQQTTRDNNKITEQLYKSQTALITDELQKQRQALIDTYNAETADLMNKYNNDKDLTEESQNNILQIIENKRKELDANLAALDVQAQQRELQTQQQTLQLRLDAAQAGSEEENSLRIQLLENQRKQEILANKQKTEAVRQDEQDINAKYDNLILQQDRQFNERRKTEEINQQYDLRNSEIDLLNATEEEKTQFRLQAERYRLQQLLALAQAGLTQMSDAEIATVKNTIAAINNEISKAQKGAKQYGDIYDLMGDSLKSLFPNADDTMIQNAMTGIETYVSFSIDQLGQLLDANVQLKEQQLQNAQEEVDAAQSKVDAEIEARNNGYANDVATAQKELQLAKKNEQQALKEKQKAQKQQQALDTLTQTSSLITASANIWSSMSGIPIVGPALAIAAIASMWASFAAAKIKAREVTKTEDAEYGEGGMEFLDGGSHQSGNDVDLGTMPDGRRRRAEGGEAFAIINKVSTRKYRKALPGIVKSLNNGTFEKKYLNAFSTDGVSINVAGATFDSKELEKDVREIKEQGKRRYIIDGKGRMVETYKNLKRIHV